MKAQKERAERRIREEEERKRRQEEERQRLWEEERLRADERKALAEQGGGGDQPGDVKCVSTLCAIIQGYMYPSAGGSTHPWTNFLIS